MSDSPVPAYVDTRKVFLQQGKISGFVALQRLPRFLECLANADGKVLIELEFTTDNSPQRLIVGELRAEIEVICQRCMEPVAIKLHDDIKLALLKDEAGIAELNSGLDPWICADTRLDLATLVEEQLMLCMPIVSYHDNQTCNSEMNYSTKQTAPGGDSPSEKLTNPFSVLKSLKENDGNN